MENLLELKNVWKSYGTTTIVENVNMTIMKDDSIAIVGKNGSGKSTLLKIMAGVNSPSAGRIVHEKNGLTIGFVLDQFPEDTPFSIEEYMYFLGKVNGLSQRFIEDTLNKQLKNFHLEAYRSKRIDTFSKGMKQKINIMQGILNSPDILILDEPLVGLDASAQKEIHLIMKSLHKHGISMIFTSHEEKLVKKLATKVMVIENGMLLQENQDNDDFNVSISFYKASPSIKHQIRNSQDAEVLQENEAFCRIAVRNERSNEYLKWILHHGGHVTEVIKNR